MKIIKPQSVGLLTRPIEFHREFWLGLSVIAFLPTEGPAVLLPETAMWPFLAEELGPDQALDAAVPKTRAEFLATAYAFAPGGQPAPRVSISIQLGELTKALDMVGDRSLDRGRVSEPVPFTRMPIDWPQAYGGPGAADNPLGKGAAPDVDERIPLPNLYDPRRDPAEWQTPVGYGPVDQTWPARARLVGTYDDAWLKQDFPGLPRDIDWTFFNVAPPDQWLPALAGDEAYALQNLHPTKPLIQGRLPGLAPRLFLVRKDDPDAFEEVALTLTTVWFFPHRERLVLVHHGRARLREEDGADIERVVVGADRAGAPRPAAWFHAVMTKRMDRKDGALHVLNDADLVPGEWVQPNAALTMPAPGTTPGSQILARYRKRAEQQAAAAGAPFATAVPLPEPPPQPASLLEVVEAARTQAASAKAEAMAALDERKAAVTAQLAAAGMSEVDIQKKLAAKPQGPPAFNAAAMRADLAGRITAMRVLGQLTMELEAQLASPEVAAQWQQAEDMIRKAYRLTAHHQDPASAAEPGRNADIRRLILADPPAARAQYDLHGADLSGLDLSGLDLSGVCLDGANLSGTRLSGTRLARAVLAHARMDGCVLEGADLTEASLGHASLVSADLRRATLTRAVLASADLTGATLAGADLERADLTGTVLDGADLDGVRAPGIIGMTLALAGFRAPGIVLDRACLLDCDLTAADLTGASAHRTVFLNAALAGAQLARARLHKAVFVKGCDLSHANLAGADLTEANLRETKLRGAALDGARLAKADLSGTDMTAATMRRALGTEAHFTTATLADADLSGSSLANADLARTDLCGADLSGVSVYQANMARTQLDATTVRTGMQLTRMRYLPLYQEPTAP